MNDTELLSTELPNGWIWTRIEDIAQTITGNTPSKKDQSNYGNYLPLIKPPQLNDRIVDEAKDYLSEKGARIGRILPSDSVLVSCIGILGKTGITNSEIAFNQQINAMIFSNVVTPKYGFYYFQNNDTRRILNNLASATTIPIINKSKFDKVPIPIPPICEQHRIVAKIEELFSYLDAGVEGLHKAKALLKRYRQAVLKAAVEGRLTEEWRKAHPEVVPIGRMDVGKIENSSSSGTIEPYKIPDGWTWTTFSNLLIEPLRNGHSAKASADGDGIRTLTLTAVTERDFSERNTKITVADSRRVKDLWLKKGDILIERSNTIDYVGLSAIYLGDNNYSIFPDLLIRARVSSSIVSPLFAEIVLRTQFSRDYFKGNAQGISGNMPKIDQGTIARLPFPLPPLGEQHCIIEEFECQISIIEELDSTVKSDQNLARRLRQSILKRAFEGKLVPQDPNDEPASVLLGRIMAEKAGQAKRTRSTKDYGTQQMRLINVQ